MLSHLFLGLGFVSKTLKLLLALSGHEKTGVAVHSLHLVEISLGKYPEEGVGRHGLDLLQVNNFHFRELLRLDRASTGGSSIAVILILSVDTIWALFLISKRLLGK